MDVKHHVYLVVTSELKNCVKVEVAYGFCGRKATLNQVVTSELRSCVKVEAAVLGSVPNKPTVSVDVKQHFNVVTASLFPPTFARP